MAKIPYRKPATTYQQQLQQLQDRGLKIEDENKAIHLLENISYYRLSGYWYPLLSDKQNHTFKKDAQIETAFSLYCFDKDLRKLVLSELEKIEVAIRAKMIYILAQSHGAFWLTNPNLFSDPIKHAKTLVKIGNEYERSDEEFIKAFIDKYSDPLPPSWMTLEITSFGTLSFLYKNLKPGKDKRAIAHHFGISDSVMETWLHSIVYLRNLCAHHSRLWNRVLSIRPQHPNTPTKTWLKANNISNKKVYFMLCAIKYLLQTVNPKSSFAHKLRELFVKHPNADIAAMGFPADWGNEDLWK